ncbi:hypothetical protein [Aureivirga sp. CE67]|uniref:hypothetical protein n=1 Tax=Aureivirga sp. CE67 TaxID=1788983 RepID=UPI0018CB9D61|nr:hypothetical protein [Aureivirga sp. CE67]
MDEKKHYPSKKYDWSKTNELIRPQKSRHLEKEFTQEGNLTMLNGKPFNGFEVELVYKDGTIAREIEFNDGEAERGWSPEYYPNGKLQELSLSFSSYVDIAYFYFDEDGTILKRYISYTEPDIVKTAMELFNFTEDEKDWVIKHYIEGFKGQWDEDIDEKYLR